MKIKRYYPKVYEFLLNVPASRERKNRALLVYRVLEGLHNKVNITEKTFIDCYFREINSINRTILKVQEDFPELKGKDHADKEELEQETMIELGYQPGYEELSDIVNSK